MTGFLNAAQQSTKMYFLCGCGIYAGCFVICVNYEYRAIYILLMAPHLLLISRDSGHRRVLALSGLSIIFAIFGLSWFHNSDYPFLMYQLCYWLLFCFSVAFCVAAVFAAWDGTDRGPLPTGSAREIALDGRNDLESTALGLCPPIADVL